MGAFGMMMELLLISCVMSGTYAASLKTCEDDNECGNGRYCFLRTNICTNCVQCSVYLRHDKPGSCTKDPSQCGECLPGFEREVLTDGRTRDLCIPVPVSHNVAVVQPQPLQVADAELSFIPYAVGAFVCGTFIVAVTLFVRWKTQQIKINFSTRVLSCDDSRSTSSSALYAPSAPPPSQVMECKNDEGTRMLERYGVQDEKFQTVAKYLDPIYVKSPYNPINNNNEVPPDTVDGPSPPNEENQPYLIDENTLPSDWTPGPQHDDQPVSISPMVTSFAGILQINAASESSRGNEGQPGNHTADDNQQNNQRNQNTQYNVTNITVINAAGQSTTGIFNISNS